MPSLFPIYLPSECIQQMINIYSYSFYFLNERQHTIDTVLHPAFKKTFID